MDENQERLLELPASRPKPKEDKTIKVEYELKEIFLKPGRMDT
jgi:hypothetical protein